VSERARPRAPIAIDVRAPRGAGESATVARRTARSALRKLGAAPCELSIALVDDAEMRELNRAWRGKDRPTDVLSFSQRESRRDGHDGDDREREAPPGAAGPPLLGDVVVSLPTAARQARRRRTPLERELATLVVHGILHLLGWDHERSPAEARRMFRMQRDLLGEMPAGRSARRRPAAGGSRGRG